MYSSSKAFRLQVVLFTVLLFSIISKAQTSNNQIETTDSDYSIKIDVATASILQNAQGIDFTVMKRLNKNYSLRAYVTFYGVFKNNFIPNYNVQNLNNSHREVIINEIQDNANGWEITTDLVYNIKNEKYYNLYLALGPTLIHEYPEQIFRRTKYAINDYSDEKSDISSRLWGLGGRFTIGIEWKALKHLSLDVEYSVGLVSKSVSSTVTNFTYVSDTEPYQITQIDSHRTRVDLTSSSIKIGAMLNI